MGGVVGDGVVTIWDFFDRHWFIALVAVATWPWALVLLVAGVVDSLHGCGTVMVGILRALRVGRDRS